MQIIIFVFKAPRKRSTQAQKVQHDQWVIMFSSTLLGDNLRTGVGENKPIADLLQIVSPRYASDIKTKLITTILNETIVYFTSLGDINNLIKQMNAAECKQFQVSKVNGIGPFWSGLVLKKNSIWFEKLNYMVTERTTRSHGNECKIITLVCPEQPLF
jgi:hypothetical protein